MDASPPRSLLEAAFIALVTLVTGLLAANHVWKDPRYRRAPVPSMARRVTETLLASTWLALAAGAAAWMVCAVISLARVDPRILLVVLGGLYAMMAVHVAWHHFQRSRGILGALLVGIFWLPLMVLMRRG